MTLAGRMVMLFPGVIAAGVIACLIWFARMPSVWPVVTLLGVVYLVPVAVFRAHQALWPIKIGGSRLVGRSYVAWWGAHQLQVIYIALPQLEALLRVLPGVYSAWLRLWGARIGKGVVWTPNIDITDRSLLDVGDHVVIGHRTGLHAHLIRPTKNNNLVLYVKPIRIDSGAFIGGYSILSPGVHVHTGASVRSEARGYPNQVFS